MSNILIYINDSLGELDWIAPFVESKEGESFIFYIYLNGPGETYQEKIDILEKYALSAENIICINGQTKKDIYLFKADEFLNRAVGRVKLYSFDAFKVARRLIDYIRFVASPLLGAEKNQFDFIFRDYNLKDSFSLTSFIRNNRNAKIIIFPHAVGLQKHHSDCIREPLKRVRAHLWLENSDLSDIAKDNGHYKDIFYASGAPSFGVNYNKNGLFNACAKRVVVITRDCGLAFGFDYEEAAKVFDGLLEKLSDEGYTVHVKHHPRDKKLTIWREIQNKYDNIREIQKGLNSLDNDYAACFTLFSTAPLFLLSRRIPIFEFSPYLRYDVYTNDLPMHYADANNLLTHDLIELKLYKRFSDLTQLPFVMSEIYLKKLSDQQFMTCKDIFPEGANQRIRDALIGLNNV